MNIVIAIIIFGLIIIIHELGHFLLAKKNGITVTEFSVGMGPRVYSFSKNGTRYSLKLLPFGGSCMMLGEDELVEDDGAFNKKPVWGRISVIAAGPIFNFILAFVLSIIIISVVGYDPANVTVVNDGMPAAEAGLKEGDLIKRMNGSKINLGREYYTFFQFNPASEEEVTIEYVRDNETRTAVVKPILKEDYLCGFTYNPSEVVPKIDSVSSKGAFAGVGIEKGDIIKSINGTEILSGTQLQQYFEQNKLTASPITVVYEREGTNNEVTVTPKKNSSYVVGMSVNTGQQKTSPLGVLRYSAAEVKYWIVTTVKSLGQLIQGKVSKDEIAGPVAIVSSIGNTVEASKSSGLLYIFLNLASISILLSANLGVMNLLPIPALDGGRLVFLLLEAVRGKPINQEREGLIHLIGLAALMVLMVFIMFNDISRLF